MSEKRGKLVPTFRYLHSAPTSEWASPGPSFELGEPPMHKFLRLSPRPLLWAALLAAGLAAEGASVLAQEGAANSEDPVVASVNGQEIHYSDVIRSAQIGRASCRERV